MGAKKAVSLTSNVKHKIQPQSANNDIQFSLKLFKKDSIKLDSFNNHYKDINHYNNVLEDFIDCLMHFSQCTIDELFNNRSKSKVLHCHTLVDEIELVEKILEKYGFPVQSIENLLSGDIFQISLVAKRDPARLVVMKTHNIVFPLFIDVNHHIYMNQKIVGDTLGYETCPKNASNNCEMMKHEDDCFMFQYIDVNRILESYDYSYS